MHEKNILNEPRGLSIIYFINHKNITSLILECIKSDGGVHTLANHEDVR